MTTEIEMDGNNERLRVGGVAHRRGPEVHTYIFACGTTTMGKPQKHKDDDIDADTGYLIARKCPKVLNDYTIAQPKIDRSNKKRQHYLAMEKRFPTHSFPFRVLTVLLGVIITDAFYLHQYLHQRDTVEWRAALRRMFFALMHNKVDEINFGSADASDLYDANWTLETQKKNKGLANPARGSKQSTFEQINGHLIVPFSVVPSLVSSTEKQKAAVVFGVWHEVLRPLHPLLDVRRLLSHSLAFREASRVLECTYSRSFWQRMQAPSQF